MGSTRWGAFPTDDHGSSSSETIHFAQVLQSGPPSRFRCCRVWWGACRIIPSFTGTVPLILLRIIMLNYTSLPWIHHVLLREVFCSASSLCGPTMFFYILNQSRIKTASNYWTFDVPLSYQEQRMSRAMSFADDGEVLDGMITRSRGEIRRTCSSKETSSFATPSRELKGIQSPRIYSPRISELRGDQSPQLSGRSPSSPRTGPSNLGKTG